MAPHDPNDSTRRTIDINLALPQGTQAVMDDLVRQMAALTPMVAALASDSPEHRAQAARQVAQTTRPGAVPRASSPFASHPTQGDRSDGVSPGASHSARLGEFATDLGHARGWSGGLDPRSLPGQIEAARQAAQANLPSAPGVSAPQFRQERWFNYQGQSYQNRNGPSAGASIPQQVTMAQKLAMGRSWLNQRIEQVATGVETRTGIPASQVRRLAHTSSMGVLNGMPPPPPAGAPEEQHHGGVVTDLAQTAVLAQLVSGGRRHAQAEGEMIARGQIRGVEAGYDRPGQINIPGTDVGMINPMDLLRRNSAFRETLNQRLNIMRLRAQGGINGDQANAIVNGLASRGWTGEQGQNMAFDYLAPLVQQGQNPEMLASMFDQAARNGQTPLSELRETLSQLGPAARAAHMGLSEYQRGLDEFANQIQERGGTYGEGVRTARTLSESYGMSPQQMGQLVNSPMTTAMAATHFGALPWEVGALGPDALAQASGTGIDMALQAFQGMPAVRGPNGQVLESSRRRQVSGAAQALGTSYETLQRYLGGREAAPHIRRAQQALRGYGDLATVHQGLDQTIHGGLRGFVNDPMNVEKGAAYIALHPRAVGRGIRHGVGHAVAHPLDTVSDIGNSIGSLFGSSSSAEKHLSETDRRADRQFNIVSDEMVNTAKLEKDPTTRSELMKQVRDIRGESDPAKRAKRAKDFLSDAAARYTNEQASDQTAYLKFTGPAAAWFEHVKKDLPDDMRRRADAGGTPRNVSAITDTSTDSLAYFNKLYGGK